MSPNHHGSEWIRVGPVAVGSAESGRAKGSADRARPAGQLGGLAALPGGPITSGRAARCLPGPRGAHFECSKPCGPIVWGRTKRLLRLSR